jgi:regulator of cell morphogenesis and NO signaling
MKNIDVNRTLGEIVAKFPGTVSTMNKYKIDFCCGGKDRLNEVIESLKLDEISLLKEMELSVDVFQKSHSKTRSWNEESLSTIIDHILHTHHVFMKETLAEINDLMFKILKVHFKTDGEILIQVHGLFGQLKTELEAHLVKEEENLFPMILAYENTRNQDLKKEIAKYIKETENEHDVAGDVFKKLEILTNDFKAPSNACYSYQRTYELLDALEKDTFNHIHMENTILFGKI